MQISLNPNILNYTAKTRPLFKGYEGSTFVAPKDNKDINVYNKTAFMRDFATLEFTKNYLVKNFPNGTNIAEFGCSLGQKPYSLLVLLDKHNDKKKFKITGYDFPEVLAKIDIPLYSVEEQSPGEEILVSGFKGSGAISKKDAEELRKVFFKYLPECKAEDLESLQEQRLYARLKRKWNIVVKPDQNKTKDAINFIPGDITNIDKILKPGKAGAVIFQNALYHILETFYTYKYPSTVALERAFDLFKKINQALPINGIFVIGNLPADHLYDDFEERNCHEKYINNRRKRVFDTSKIHNMLYSCGFEPVFYEKISDGIQYLQDTNVYLPSVWKKSEKISTCDYASSYFCVS